MSSYEKYLVIGGKYLIQQRSVGLGIILSLITCGIYSLYWMYAITNEVGYLSDDPSFTGGKTILFTIITCGIYALFWYYMLGGKLATAQMKKGYPAKDDGVLFIILGIFGLGIISMAIAQSNVNNLVA